MLRLLKLLYLILLDEHHLSGHLWIRFRLWGDSLVKQKHSSIGWFFVRHFVVSVTRVELVRWRFAADLALLYGDVRTIQEVGESLTRLAHETDAGEEYVRLGNEVKDRAEEIVIKRHWSYRL
jgi:hypothetical protein